SATASPSLRARGRRPRRPGRAARGQGRGPRRARRGARTRRCRGDRARVGGSVMMEGPAETVYRGVMTTVAGVAGALGRVGAARGFAERLGRLSADERTLASGGTAVWLHG